MDPMLAIVATTLALHLSMPSADRRETTQAPGVDACTLFTLEEAGKATSRSFRRARPGKRPGSTTCALVGGTEGNINLTLSPSSSKKDWDEFRKLLTDQGEKLEAVSGVGDEAFYWGNRIYVRVGSQQLAIWNGDPGQPLAKSRADALALARLSVPKLK